MKNVKKVYGPYLRKDGRKHVIVIYIDGSRRTVSYPKWIMEQKLGRELDPNKETVDHVDRNHTNDSLDNLQILERSKHASLDVKRAKLYIFKCVWCGIKFKARKSVRLRSKKDGKAGPFCGGSCRGKYGAYIQNGYCKKIDNNLKEEIKYFRKKK